MNGKPDAVVSQIDHTINRSYNTGFPLIDSYWCSAFCFTCFTNGGGALWDVWMQIYIYIFFFSHGTQFLYHPMYTQISVPNWPLLPPCLCFIFLYIFSSVSTLVQCPFLEGLVEAIPSPLPSQQGSSINKRTAPHCTIMGKNKLRQDFPSFSSFNTHCLMTLCAHIPMQLCAYLTKKGCV